MSSEPADYDALGRTVAWRTFYDEARDRLATAGFESADIEARRIVEEASGYEGAEFHEGLGVLATKRGVVSFDQMLQRRLDGEPLQYVLGRWGFRNLDLFVDRRVLIPRPETEVVAGIALEELERMAEPGRRLTAVDLGTGSGAIGLSLADEHSTVEVFLTDASTGALEVARANLAGLGRAATRVSIAQGSWFDALRPQLRGAVDVLVSNPPYVATEDTLPVEVSDWEPNEALIAADGGRAEVAHIVERAGEWLRSGGALVVEMAPHQTQWAAGHAQQAGFAEIEVFSDLAGRERGLRARWSR